MGLPLVSVIMLTYNQQIYVEEAIKGVLKQDVSFQYELIIHDDCSTDNTRNIIQRYQKNYPDLIKLILPDENRYSKGIDMFDCCMRQARGKYIAWCEGEDLWLTDHKLQMQVDFLERNPEYSLVFTDLDIYVEKKGITIESAIQNGFITPPMSFETQLYRAGFLAPLTWVFRRDCYVPNTKRDVDWSYSISLDLLANGKVKFIKETTALYRIFLKSVSNSTTISELVEFGKGLIKIKRKYIVRYQSLLNEQIIERVIAHSYYTYLVAAIAVNDTEYLKEAVQAFKSNKFHPIIYLIKFRKILMIPQIARMLYHIKGRK